MICEKTAVSTCTRIFPCAFCIFDEDLLSQTLLLPLCRYRVLGCAVRIPPGPQNPSDLFSSLVTTTCVCTTGLLFLMQTFHLSIYTGNWSKPNSPLKYGCHTPASTCQQSNNHFGGIVALISWKSRIPPNYTEVKIILPSSVFFKKNQSAIYNNVKYYKLLEAEMLGPLFLCPAHLARGKALFWTHCRV